LEAPAYVRHKFVDIHRSQGSPIAEEAIGRIAQLYAVEKEARGSLPDHRAELRQAHAAPVFDDLERWLAMQLTTISGKSPLASAIRYALTRMERLRPYLDHGILELDNNAAERGMRAVALGRKNSHDRCQGHAHGSSTARHLAETKRAFADGLMQGAEVVATVAQTLIRGSCAAP